MAGSTGLYAQWCAVDETTYGVAPALTSAVFIAPESDTLELAKVTKQGAGIFSGSLAPRAARRTLTEYSAKGDLVLELPERGMNEWLYRMMGSYGQAAAVLTQDATTGAYSASHALGSIDGNTFAVQKGAPTVDGTVEPLTYTGCKVQAWEVACAMGEIAKLTLTVEGRNELAGSHVDPLNASVPALQAYTAPASGGIFKWVGGSVVYGGTVSTTSGVSSVAGGTTAANLTGNLQFKMSRPLDLTRYAPDVAPYRNEPLQDGVTAITGQFGVEWLSAETYLAAYSEDTATAIELQFINDTIGTGSDKATFSILIPNVRLEGESVKIPGPQVLKQTLPFTGLDDGTNNIAQVTYWTLDTA